MSVRKLQQVKKSLTKPQALLNGKPLIKITERTTKHGDPDTDLVEIIDIWPDNFLYFIQKSSKGGAPYAPGVVHEMHEGGASHAPKEEQTKEEPIRRTTTQPVVAKSASRVVVSSHLKKYEIPHRLAIELSQHPEDKIIKAIKCLERNGGPVLNIYGFLKSAIESNWEPKLSDKEMRRLEERKEQEKRDLVKSRMLICQEYCDSIQEEIPQGYGLLASDSHITIKNGERYLPIGYLEQNFFEVLAGQVKRWSELLVPKLMNLIEARGC